MANQNIPTPEGFINQQAKLMRRQIQQEYNAEHSALSKRTIKAGVGQIRYDQVMGDLNSRYRTRMARYNQEIEQKIFGLRKPDEPSVTEQRLEEVARRGKAGTMTQEQVTQATDILQLGPSVAAKLHKEQPDKLRALINKRTMIDKRLKDFEVTPGTERAKYPIPFGLGPKKQVKPSEVQIWDTTLYSRDEKGNIIMGGLRKASKMEVEERLFFLNMKARNMAEIRMLSDEHRTGPLIQSHLADSRNNGAIGDQLTAYMGQKETRRSEQQEPEDFGTMSIEELRRIAEGR